MHALNQIRVSPHGGIDARMFPAATKSVVASNQDSAAVKMNIHSFSLRDEMRSQVSAEYSAITANINTRNVINPVANEDVRKLRAFSLNQPQFSYWRPPLPVTSGRDDVTSG